MAIERNTNALHPAAGGMVTISISNEIARLKESSDWKSWDRHAVTILKNRPLNVLLMVPKTAAKAS
jgi:hypothetical protein